MDILNNQYTNYTLKMPIFDSCMGNTFKQAYLCLSVYLNVCPR